MADSCGECVSGLIYVSIGSLFSWVLHFSSKRSKDDAVVLCSISF